MEEFDKIAKRCADKILGAKDVLLVSHIDADGLTSAGIMSRAMKRAGIKHDIKFCKKLDPETIEEVAKLGAGRTVVFTDLGSGFIGRILEAKIDVVIADHHQPNTDTSEGRGAPIEYEYHLNPHLVGMSGATDISGSGCAFTIAMQMDGANIELSDLAIVGAVGDLQDTAENKFVGINAEILKMAAEAGMIECKKDLKMYGKQTRPIHKVLQFNSDPYIPGLTANERACVDFVHDLGIPLKTTTWRRWIDLFQDEKREFISGLMRYCVEKHVPMYKMQRILGDTYVLLKEEEGTALRDASEFSTLLNATARYDFSDVGLQICMGDRGPAYKRACDLLDNHRQNIVRGLELVNKMGMKKLQHVQYFHAKSEIKDTIVGIVAGMSYNSPGVDRNKPIFAFSYTEGGVKVSARGNRDLVNQGLNLAKAIAEVAPKVGGNGGGHNIAAGAFVPMGKEEEFMQLMDAKVGEQLSRKSIPTTEGGVVKFKYNKG